MTSSHHLCIYNHSSVYTACKDVSPNWEDFAALLSVPRPMVERIRQDGKDSSDCLRRMLDEWLKRSSPDQPLPSWRVLCDALSSLDLSLSERISSQHQCGCSICTGLIGVAAVGIVRPLYNDIYQQLKNPVGVAEFMFSERAFSLEQLEHIRESPGNGKEVLFTVLESVVTVNQCYLRVFAEALIKEATTCSLGKTLLTKCKIEEFPSQSKIKKITVNMQYKREFENMRVALGQLCASTVKLLQEKPVDITELKNQLEFAFPELENNLEKSECCSLNHVLKNVIRPRISLIQIDYLEAIFDMFGLAPESIQSYNKKIQSFCETMRADHAYGQMLMEEFDNHISELESIRFVLDWNGNEHHLNDIQDLFKKVVRSYSNSVKVIVAYEGNSIVLECCVPAHLLSVIVRMIQDREEILYKERVISVSAGGHSIFKRSVIIEQIHLMGQHNEEELEVTDFYSDSASVYSASVAHSSGIDPGELPLSIDDDLINAEGISVYETVIRDYERNEKELKQKLLIKDNIIGKLSIELDLFKEKTMAESKWQADFENEKMMIELEIKEMIARHKTDMTDRMGWASKIKEQLMIAEAKLAEKSNENERLQVELKKALTEIKAHIQAEDNKADELKKLSHQLEVERLLKKETVNKLTQVMFRQQHLNRSNQQLRPISRQPYEREIRQLKGVLQQETQKNRRLAEKYQQQLEEMHKQLMQEMILRKELQIQLQQSKGELQRLERGVKSGKRVFENDGKSLEPDETSTSPGRIVGETLHMQIPKESDARKKGWRDVFVVLSHTDRKLYIFDLEEDLSTKVMPILQFEFEQIHGVRTLKPGEYERVKVKPNDAKQVLYLTYEGRSINTGVGPTSEFDSVVHIRGHHLAEVCNSSHAPCDICGKPLPLALITPVIYECQECRMKCHKDDMEKADLMKPCRTGTKTLLLLVNNDDERMIWLSKLNSLAVDNLDTGISSLIPKSSPKKHGDQGGSTTLSSNIDVITSPKKTSLEGKNVLSKRYSVTTV